MKNNTKESLKNALLICAACFICLPAVFSYVAMLASSDYRMVRNVIYAAVAGEIVGLFIVLSFLAVSLWDRQDGQAGIG